MKFKIGKDISVIDFIKSRIVTPKQIVAGMKDSIYSNTSIGRILFNARYKSGKAIDGYDFEDFHVCDTCFTMNKL